MARLGRPIELQKGSGPLRGVVRVAVLGTLTVASFVAVLSAVIFLTT